MSSAKGGKGAKLPKAESGILAGGAGPSNGGNASSSAAAAAPVPAGDLSSDALDAKILGIFEQVFPRQIGDNELMTKLDVEIPKLARATAYNRLLAQGRLELAQRTGANGGKESLFKFVDSKTASRLAGFGLQERHIYQLIERSKTEGVTKRDLKIKTNIKATGELNDYLDRLQQRGLVKEIQSVQGGRRKVWMLSSIKPSAAHTGGPWYDDSGTYDEEFIGAMYGVVLNFVSVQKAAVSVEQIRKFVDGSGISKEKLSVEDLRRLLDTMLYDGEVEMVSDSRAGEDTKFRKARLTPAVNHLSTLPCGTCPVFRDCTPDGVISPTTCVYMNNWLKSAVDW